MSQKHVPYFDFYPSHFMGGIRGLTAAEVGIYTMILCRIYEEGGPVEYVPVRLAAYCGTKVPALERAVARLVELGKFRLAENTISNDRAEAEIVARETKLKAQVRAGKASADKRQQKQHHHVNGDATAFNHKIRLEEEEKSSVASATDAEASSTAEPGEKQAPEKDLEPQGEPDLAKELFDRAVVFLGRHGTSERQARSFVGKLRKAHSDGGILEAFTACSKAGAVDPVPWIIARLGTGPPPAVDMDAIWKSVAEGTARQ